MGKESDPRSQYDFLPYAPELKGDVSFEEALEAFARWYILASDVYFRGGDLASVSEIPLRKVLFQMSGQRIEIEIKEQFPEIKGEFPPDRLEKPYLLIAPYPSYDNPVHLFLTIAKEFVDEEDDLHLRVLGRESTRRLMGIGPWVDPLLIPVPMETRTQEETMELTRKAHHVLRMKKNSLFMCPEGDFRPQGLCLPEDAARVDNHWQGWRMPYMGALFWSQRWQVEIIPLVLTEGDKPEVVIGKPFGPCPSERRGILRVEDINLLDRATREPYLLGMMRKMADLFPYGSEEKGIFREGDMTLVGRRYYDFETGEFRVFGE